jgi:glutathione S-transferase
MRRLYHLWLSPASRAVRLLLAEKGLEFEALVEPTWERREEFLAMNPTGDVPVFIDTQGEVISEMSTICEYLEEVYPEVPMIPGSATQRAEIRRITSWFSIKFQREVTRNLVDEKVMKRFMGMGQPDARAIRIGHQNITYHMEYLCYLAERRTWLAGEAFSLADIVAAAQLSCLDYLGDVPWENHEQAKNWYARIKSRPTFRSLLTDRIGGLKPADHYHDLDF